MLIILILWYITSLVLIISQLNVFTFWIAFSNNFNKVNMGQSVLLLQSDVWHRHWTPILALQRYICIKWSGRGSRSVMSDSLWPHGLYSLWNSPGQNTGVGSLSLLQGNLPKPEIKPRSSALQADSLPAEPPGKPNWSSDGWTPLPSGRRGWALSHTTLLSASSAMNKLCDFGQLTAPFWASVSASLKLRKMSSYLMWLLQK